MRIAPVVHLAALLMAAGNIRAADPVPSPGVPPLYTRQLLESGRPVRIACFGDSVTGIYYHTGGRRAWSDLVGLALRQVYPQASVEMINVGVSGNSTADALLRMEADVLSHHPDLVMVMFGLNDVAKLPPEIYRANLGRIVQQARQAGAEVILMTPTAVSAGDPLRPPKKVAQYAQIAREVGRDARVPVADTFHAFESIQASDHSAWVGMMSDSIHPNMRGHRILATEVVDTLTGQRVTLGELPRLQPGLPRSRARLEAKETLRVIAMKPYDTLIVAALRRTYPNAVVEVTAWDAAGKSLPAIEEQAKDFGWPKYRQQPQLARPDLVVLAVPAEADGGNRDQYFHSYTWIMNWSQSFSPPRWDCWVILPSLAQPGPTGAQRAAEIRALEVIEGQDLPWLQRPPGNTLPAVELLGQELARLFER